MSYHERTSIGYIIGTILVLIGYGIYLSNLSQSGELETADLRFWAIVLLVLILIQIVLNIVINIILTIIKVIITKEEDTSLADERDKLIELKSIRNAYTTFTIGFLIAMVSLVIEQPAYVMFNILIFSLFIASLVWSFTHLFYYRRGF